MLVIVGWLGCRRDRRCLEAVSGRTQFGRRVKEGFLEKATFKQGLKGE